MAGGFQLYGFTAALRCVNARYPAHCVYRNLATITHSRALEKTGEEGERAGRREDLFVVYGPKFLDDLNGPSRDGDGIKVIRRYANCS